MKFKTKLIVCVVFILSLLVVPALVFYWVNGGFASATNSSSGNLFQTNRPQFPDQINAEWDVRKLILSDGETEYVFVGLIYFYKDGEPDPVEVEGTLDVYCFVEDGDLTDPRPDKKYTWDNQVMPKLYEKTTLGHAYRVWLPWGSGEDGIEQEISLLPSFLTEDGIRIVGDQVTVKLPGADSLEEDVSGGNQ